jgi:hypothetical protein
VAATAGGHDTLAFAGKSAAAVTGIGTQFTGFGTFAFAEGAEWTIAGTQAGLASGEQITGFTTTDAIILTDAAASGAVSVVTAGTVSIDAGGTIYNLDIAGATVGETNFQFAHHTLIETDALIETNAAMRFLAPAASQGIASAGHAAALFTLPAIENFWLRAAPVVTGAVATLHGFRQDLSRPHENTLLPAVTLHA